MHTFRLIPGWYDISSLNNNMRPVRDSREYSYIVAHHIQTRQRDDDGAGRAAGGYLVVHHSDDDLHDAAYHEAGQEEDATAAVPDNHKGVGDDGDEAGRAEDV